MNFVYATETPKLLFAHHGEPKGSPALLCVFNIPVENPSELAMTLNDGILNFADQVQIPSNWSNPWNISRSKLWVFDMTDLAPPPSALFEGCPEFPKYFDNETQVYLGTLNANVEIIVAFNFMYFRLPFCYSRRMLNSKLHCVASWSG